jgi:hypothetical protein
MKTYSRILLFFVLPVIAPLLFPPDKLLGVVPDVLLGVMMAVVAFFIGFFLWQGYSLALTFSIFLQGFNVITRLMMFFSTIVTLSSANQPQFDPLYTVTSVLSMGISLWVLLRLDRVDVHAQMTR